MTPFKEILTNYKETSQREIIAANNERMLVKYAGDSKLNLHGSEVSVENVLHVPNLAINLLSVHKIVSKGNTITFNENGCTIFNKENKIDN